MSLAKVLEEDYRLLHHMCHISNDFVEGIRAKLIEKDNNARWKPATVDEVLSFLSSPTVKLDAMSFRSEVLSFGSPVCSDIVVHCQWEICAFLGETSHMQ